MSELGEEFFQQDGVALTTNGDEHHSGGEVYTLCGGAAEQSTVSASELTVLSAFEEEANKQAEIEEGEKGTQLEEDHMETEHEVVFPEGEVDGLQDNSHVEAGRLLQDNSQLEADRQPEDSHVEVEQGGTDRQQEVSCVETEQGERDIQQENDHMEAEQGETEQEDSRVEVEQEGTDRQQEDSHVETERGEPNRQQEDSHVEIEHGEPNGQLEDSHVEAEHGETDKQQEDSHVTRKDEAIFNGGVLEEQTIGGVVSGCGNVMEGEGVVGTRSEDVSEGAVEGRDSGSKVDEEGDKKEENVWMDILGNGELLKKVWQHVQCM